MTHQSLCDRLEAYFKARPYRYVPARALLQVGGVCSWRTRISELRRSRGMVIKYKPAYVRRGSRRLTISFYRYLPADLLAVAEVEPR